MVSTEISTLTTQVSTDTLPASHAPCIKGRGRVLRGFACFLLMAALTAYILDLPEYALFLGTTGSLILFSMACLYSYILILWRTMRQGAFLYAVNKKHIRIALPPGETLSIPIKLTNGLRCPLRITETKILGTTHLSPPSLEPFYLSPLSVTEVSLDFKIMKRGPASLHGAQFTFEDALGFIQSSLLIALQTDIDLITSISPHPTPGTEALGRHPISEELDEIRPYQRGDTLKRIFWRGFAKTGELMTRTSTPRKEQCHIALLIDVSPLMSETLPDQETRLHTFLPESKACLRRADAVTLFACTRQESRLLLKHVNPSEALERLDSLCLRQHLFMRPITHSDWNHVVRIIWKDLACFRNRDFTRVIDKKNFIDAPIMMRWLRYDLAIEHDEEARQILRSDDKTVATRYMRERRLEYEYPVPRMHARFSLALKHIHTFPFDARPQEIWCLSHTGLKRIE